MTSDCKTCKFCELEPFEIPCFDCSVITLMSKDESNYAAADEDEK